MLGSMDPDDIRAVLRENIKNFKICFNVANRKFGDFQAMRLFFSINKDGKVFDETALLLSGNLKERRLPIAMCVKKKLKDLQFSRPSGGGVVNVQQPFRFWLR